MEAIHVLGAYLWTCTIYWQEIMEHTFTFFATLLKEKKLVKKSIFKSLPHYIRHYSPEFVHSMRFVSHSLFTRKCYLLSRICLDGLSENIQVFVKHLARPEENCCPENNDRHVVLVLINGRILLGTWNKSIFFLRRRCVQIARSSMGSVVTCSRIGDNWCFKYRIRIGIVGRGHRMCARTFGAVNAGHLMNLMDLCALRSEHIACKEKSLSIRINESSHAQFGRARLLEVQEVGDEAAQKHKS